jgi:hypothetical protein
MKAEKRDRLERKGWRIAGAQEFLELPDEQVAYIELKLALADLLRAKRAAKGFTQSALAELTGSSQSRVAKMECADSSVSLDLLIRSLLAMGTSRREMALALERSA